MRFCPNCDNMLYPKKEAFYCNICDEGFSLKINKQEYILNKKINKEYNLMAPIIVKTPKRDQFLTDNRRTYENVIGCYD